MRFIFKTETTMKKYNCNKWWIVPDAVREFSVDADDLSAALDAYRNFVMEKSCVEISKSAFKKKQSMYVDTDSGPEQVGYVITGKTLFEDSDSCKWTYQYIDLWITILTVVHTNFEKEIA